MPFWTKVSGVWKAPQLWINVGGVWKSPILWTKVSGVWKAITALFQYPSGDYDAYAAFTAASFTFSCIQNATWTYSGGGDGGSVSIGSGGVAPNITFYCAPGASGSSRVLNWTISATSGAETVNYNLTLAVDN